jgi:hypothetical protein
MLLIMTLFWWDQRLRLFYLSWNKEQIKENISSRVRDAEIIGEAFLPLRSEAKLFSLRGWYICLHMHCEFSAFCVRLRDYGMLIQIAHGWRIVPAEARDVSEPARSWMPLCQYRIIRGWTLHESEETSRTLPKVIEFGITLNCRVQNLRWGSWSLEGALCCVTPSRQKQMWPCCWCCLTIEFLHVLACRHQVSVHKKLPKKVWGHTIACTTALPQHSHKLTFPQTNNWLVTQDMPFTLIMKEMHSSFWFLLTSL